MSYMQDPNMEEARKKIVAVLKEHDLMGAVIFTGKERSGFFHELSPSWSCASLDETAEGVGIRIKSKREDYQSTEEQADSIRFTVGGLMGLLHVHQFIGQMLTAVVQLISTRMDISHVVYDQKIQKADPRE